MSLISTADNPAPPDAIEAEIVASDGVRLRTARWDTNSARGTVAVFGGRGEFIEKYFELAGDLIARGFCVLLMDWRGQGGSDRPLRIRAKGTSTIFRCLSAIWKRWSSRSWSPFVRGHGSGSRIRWARRCCWLRTPWAARLSTGWC